MQQLCLSTPNQGGVSMLTKEELVQCKQDLIFLQAYDAKLLEAVAISTAKSCMYATSKNILERIYCFPFEIICKIETEAIKIRETEIRKAAKAYAELLKLNQKDLLGAHEEEREMFSILLFTLDEIFSVETHILSHPTEYEQVRFRFKKIFADVSARIVEIDIEPQLIGA